jgi:two-component system phosphate regulon response regulator PhoB
MSEKTIVVIEDEGDILEVIAYNLRREGYRVKSSRDGVEGFRLIQTEAPDLVLLDLMLPGLDGIEVCRKLNGYPGHHGDGERGRERYCSWPWDGCR